MRDAKPRHPALEDAVPTDPRERLNRAAGQLHGGHRSITFEPAPEGVEARLEGVSALKPPASPQGEASEEERARIKAVRERLREQFGGRYY